MESLDMRMCGCTVFNCSIKIWLLCLLYNSSPVIG
uniref:Uncharacterized protein n=1 Tax=Anguilla anguilla TaxID=7936 RepID=A0A0E9URW4_ANGAN